MQVKLLCSKFPEWTYFQGSSSAALVKKPKESEICKQAGVKQIQQSWELSRLHRFHADRFIDSFDRSWL